MDQRDRDKFACGEKENLATVAFVDGNHWVGLIVEWSTGMVRYGDSLGHNCPSWILETIQWWFSMHRKRSSPITLTTLPVSRQTDSFSCGLMAVNSVSNYLSSYKFPLIRSDEVDWARLEILIKIFERHMDLAGALPSSDDLWNISLGIPNISVVDEEVTIVGGLSPLATPVQKGKDLDPDFIPTDNESEESNTDSQPTHSFQKRDHSSCTPPQSPQKKKRRHSHKKPQPMQKSLKSFFSQKLTQLPPSIINTDDEEHDDWEEVNGTTRVGRPTEGVLDLVSRRFIRSMKGKAVERVHCLGCRYTWKGVRNRSRVLKHASTCPSLEPDLRRRASIAISKDSFSHKVEAQVFNEATTGPKSKEPATKVQANYFGEQG